MKSLLATFVICQSVFGADYLTGQAARLVIGQSTFTAVFDPVTSAGVQATSSTVLGAAGGVAYANNMLFVVDGSVSGAAPVNNRVLIYTPVSGFPTPIPSTAAAAPALSPTCLVCVGTPTTVVGEPDFVSSAPGVSQSTMYTPSAVATDGTVLAVADTNNNRVLIWKSIPTSSGQNADVVVGQPNFTSGASRPSPTASSLRGPQGVWIWNGKLYIADTFNNRVLIYNSIPTVNGAAADLVLGQADFTTFVSPGVTQFTVPATQSNFASPTSVTTEGTHLFVTDLGNSRVMIWNALPTTNNQPASIEIGQPDFTTGVPDDAFTGSAATTAGSVATTGQETPVLCPTPVPGGADANGNPTFYSLCANTLSFPRFAFADNQGRLYVADSGNDRVLVYKTIPTSNAAAADVVLGEPDANTDSPTSNSDSLQTPSGMAWDGTNLYVADPYNLRVVVYTPMGNALPLTAVRNSASLEIFATGYVVFSGTPAAKDTVTITIATTTYTYTVKTNDTLADIVTGLVAQINGTAAGSTADPNVIAVSDTAGAEVLLTARLPGAAGQGTVLTAGATSASIVATASAGTILIHLADPTQIAPGTLITVYGTNFTSQTAAADPSQPNLPRTLGGVTLYIDGLQAPLLYVSPGQINAQMPYEVANRSSVTVWEVNSDGGAPVATDAVGSVIAPENPGLFALPGNDPRPGLVYHFGPNATGLVSVDGSISAGDIATVYICDSACSVGSIPAGARAYNYTVQSTDTLESVRDALVATMANDPEVIATPSNTFTRILLQARTPGPAGNNIYYAANQNSAAILVMTASTAQLCCGNSTGGQVTLANPAVPGEVVYTYATGLGVTNPATDSITGKYVSGHLNPPEIPVDSILTGLGSALIVDAALVPGSVGLFTVSFQLSPSLTTNNLTQLTIAQQLHVSNIVTFPVVAP